MADHTIRDAMPGDESLICALLAEFAVFEKLTHTFVLTEADVTRDLLGPGRVATCDLVFVDGAAAGLSIWFWTYRSFRARRGLFVEDLYVRPAFRGQGLGTAMLARLGRTALDQGGWLEWVVLDWNAPAIAFYDKLGARRQDEWIGYKLEGEGLERLAS